MQLILQKGWKSWGVQATENPITAWLLLGSAALFVFQAATAGGQQWAGYSKLFDESRFCHVTTIDFLALTVSAPVWMWNDAEVRQWQNRSVRPGDIAWKHHFLMEWPCPRLQRRLVVLSISLGYNIELCRDMLFLRAHKEHITSCFLKMHITAVCAAAGASGCHSLHAYQSLAQV